MVINTHWWYGPYPKHLIAKINSFQINSSSKALQVAMTWIRFYLLLASDICRYCDRGKKKEKACKDYNEIKIWSKDHKNYPHDSS